MVQELEDLVARANAAAVEATLLIEINLEWQCRAYSTLRRMRMRAIFDAAPDLRTKYPQDLIEPRRPPYEPFPSEDDGLNL